MTNAHNERKGFTLIELLVVIAILSILLVIVLVAINPARQTQKARNTQRRADVLVMLNAVNAYFVEEGAFPDGSPAAGAGAKDINSTAMAGTDFCTDLISIYVAKFPFDPSKSGATFTDCATTPWDTGYTISISATDDRVTITAPYSTSDGSPTVISATR